MHRPHLRSLLWLTAVVMAPGVAQAQAHTHTRWPPAEGPLPAPVLAALQGAELPPEALAAVALPLAGAKGSRWQRAWGHQAQRSMQPGSAMKVVTSVVALDRLGPNLRGSTELRSAAPLLPDGTLQGDLVLKGGADPELGVPQFWGLLQELRAAGVHTVAGNLVVDRTLWRPARMDQGLPPFDAAPEFAYNVIPDALQLAGALLPLRLSSSESGLQAEAVPPLPGLRLESRMALNDSRCAACAENPERECGFICDRFYVTDIGHPKEAQYAGVLKAYEWRTREQIARMELGPKALVEDAITDGRLASCSTVQLFRRLYKREPTEAEVNGELLELSRAFQAGGFNFKSLVKSLVQSPGYRRLVR